MPSRGLVLLLALLPFAGCLGAEPVETASAPATATPGGPGAAADASNATLAPANATAGVPSVAVDWDGSLGAGACFPMGPNSCMVPFAVAEKSYEPLPRLSGNGTGELTLTWTASSPLTEELVLRLFSVKSCGERCYEGTGYYQHVSGPSPLVLAVDAPALPEGESFIVAVNQPRLTPEPVYGFVRTEQPFHVEGVLQATV